MKVALLSMVLGTCAFFISAGVMSGSRVFYISLLLVLGISLSALALTKVYSRISLSRLSIVLFMAILVPALFLLFFTTYIEVLFVIVWYLLGAALGVLRYLGVSVKYASPRYMGPSKPVEYHRGEDYREKKSA
jgi:hypothetical protein